MIPLSKTKAKYIKSLQLKKQRDIENLFIVEGKKSVLEFIKSNFIINSIVLTQDFYEENKSQLDQFDLFITKPKELSAIGSLKTNDSAIAIVEKPDHDKRTNDSKGIILVLDGINDPGNLGTIIRTADWFGIKQVVLSDNSVDPFNPKVVNASKGSMSRVVVNTESLKEFLSKYEGVVYSAEMYGIDLKELSPISEGVIIMGSESHGVSKELKEFVTKTITIPSVGQAESLNVGVATGIICNHLISRN